MKKLWILALLAVGVAGCAESSGGGSTPNEPTPTDVTCGNGALDPDEKCDSPDKDVDCSIYDSSKIWEDGGKAHCAADCKSIAAGTGKERQTVAGVCGDGVINTGEICDKDDGVSCAAFDASKVWKDGGKAECAADCKSFASKGTCEEA